MHPTQSTGINVGHTREGLGLVHVYTGEGKGKSTSSVGLAVRAIGAGYKVMYRQLFKNISSEVGPMQTLGINYKNYSTQHPYFRKFTPEQFEEEVAKCTAFIRESFEEAASAEYDMLLIDELGPALAAKMIKVDDVIELIKNKPKKLELVMTGRGYPQVVLDLCDYVSEIKMVFHPFEKGIQARRGVEY
jgi:cob(I)alamin adenosyltransferase